MMEETKPEVIAGQLTPNSLPRRGEEKKKGGPVRGVRNPLDFAPRTGWLGMVRVPGIIFFGMIVAYVVGRWRMSFLWMLPVAHIVYYVFSRRVRKYRLTLETLAEERERRTMLGEYETVEWLNYIVRKFWEVSEARVSSEIYSAVNRELKANCPALLKSLKLTELTLGTRPPVVERIGFVNRNDDAISVEFAMNFIPLQTSADLLAYFGEEKKHWNTCIELTATVGFLSLPVLVRNFTFSGIFRADISLTREIPFLRSLSLCMLELPLIDFELQPLKTVDFMDLPYLASAIHGIINAQVQKQLLYPQCLDIDLQNVAQYSGVVIGVVYVHIGQLETALDAAASVALSIDGREFAQTAQQRGAHPRFDEGFYAIVRDTTRSLGVVLAHDRLRLHGKIHLRNLNRHFYSERLHLAAENTRRFLAVSTRFFPLVSRPSTCGIVALGIVCACDLQRIGDPRNRVYSTYCRVSLETKESVRIRSIVQTRESKRIFSSKDPYYNESFSFFVKHFPNYIFKISIMDEKTDQEIASTVIPITGVEDTQLTRYRLGGVESGSIEVKYSFNYVDFNNECDEGNEGTKCDECTEGTKCDKCNVDNDIDNTDDSSTGDSIETTIRENDIQNKADQQHSIPGAFIPTERRKAKLKKSTKTDQKTETVANQNLGIYNTNSPLNSFVDFTTAYKFEVVDISEPGTFYLIFETNYLNVKMEPFSTEIGINRHVIVPIKDELTVRVRLFRMSGHGDILVSEELFNLNESVIVFETVRVSLRSSSKPLARCSSPDTSDNFKITQLRISGLPSASEYAVNLETSVMSVHNKVPGITFLLSGPGPIRAALLEDAAEVASFDLPVTSPGTPFNFSPRLTGSIEVATFVCPFKLPVYSSQGSIEIYIIKASNIKHFQGAVPNPYIKVFLNNEKIFKTGYKPSATNPIYNESLKVNINKATDILSFHICEYNAVSSVNIISYKEFPLVNISEGYGRFDIQMDDAQSGKPVDTTLQIIANYSHNPRASDSETFKAWNS